VKWFPDRRGLAVGLTAAGFGAGAAVTVIPIQMLIAARGYEATFLVFAIGQGTIVFVLAWLLRPPLPGEVPAVMSPKLRQAAHSSTPREVLASPIFWLLYVMFVAVSASGLMATAQIALIAKSYGIADSVLLLGATTLTVALIVDSVMNGLARPFFGWVSDRLGREYTMAVAFGLGGVAYWLLGTLGTSPWAFVVFAGLIFFTWGEIFRRLAVLSRSQPSDLS
jgi:OFA family oxalate/formate antiporter-like MFS transporter